MSKKSPLAAAILLKLKKGDRPESEESEDSEDSYDPSSEAKAGAVKQLFKALKSQDVAMGVEALDNFVRACEPSEDTEEDTDY